MNLFLHIYIQDNKLEIFKSHLNIYFKHIKSIILFSLENFNFSNFYISFFHTFFIHTYYLKQYKINSEEIVCE